MSNSRRVPPCLGEGGGSPTLIPFLVTVVVLVITAIVFAIRQWQLGSAVHERNVLLEEKKQQDLAVRELVERKEIDEAIAKVLKIEDRIKKLDGKIAKTRLAHVDLEVKLEEVKSWSDLDIK